MRVLSSAAIWKVLMARSTSMRAVLMGLPASWQMVRANSSRRAVIPSAILRRMRGALVRRHLARDGEGVHRRLDGDSQRRRGSAS